MWRHGLPPNDVGLLDRLAATGVPVPTPITTATIGGYPCALFAHVAGRHATDADRVAVAKAIRTVHDTLTTGLGLVNRGPDEASVAGMRALLDHPWIADRRDEVARTVDRMCFMPLLPPRSRKLRISRSGLGLAPMMKTTKSPSMSAVNLPLSSEPIRLLSRSRQPTEMSGVPSVRHGAQGTSCLGERS